MYKSFSEAARVQTSMYKSVTKTGRGRGVAPLPQQGDKRKKRQERNQAEHESQGGKHRQPPRQLLAKPSHESIWFTRRCTAA